MIVFVGLFNFIWGLLPPASRCVLLVPSHLFIIKWGHLYFHSIFLSKFVVVVPFHCCCCCFLRIWLATAPIDSNYFSYDLTPLNISFLFNEPEKSTAQNINNDTCYSSRPLKLSFLRSQPHKTTNLINELVIL